LFDFGGSDTWMMATNNSEKIKNLRIIFSVDWVPGEDSWVQEKIKEKSVFTRDPIECESAWYSQKQYFKKSGFSKPLV